MNNIKQGLLVPDTNFVSRHDQQIFQLEPTLIRKYEPTWSKFPDSIGLSVIISPVEVIEAPWCITSSDHCLAEALLEWHTR